VAGPRQIQAHAQFLGPLERVPSKEGDVRGWNRETSDRSGMHFIYDRFRPWIADSLAAKLGWDGVLNCLDARCSSESLNAWSDETRSPRSECEAVNRNPWAVRSKSQRDRLLKDGWRGARESPNYQVQRRHADASARGRASARIERLRSAARGRALYVSPFAATQS